MANQYQSETSISRRLLICILLHFARPWQHKRWLLVLLQLHGNGRWIDWHGWKSTGDCNPNLDIVLCVDHFGINEVVKESRTCSGPSEEQFYRSHIYIYIRLYMDGRRYGSDHCIHGRIMWSSLSRTLFCTTLSLAHVLLPRTGSQH